MKKQQIELDRIIQEKINVKIKSIAMGLFLWMLALSAFYFLTKMPVHQISTKDNIELLFISIGIVGNIILIVLLLNLGYLIITGNKNES